MPRVFVRIANSTQELGASADLLQTLRAHLPGSQVHLLVLIDLQKTSGLVFVDTLAGNGLLFYRVSEAVYANRGVDHTERMRLNGEAYAEGIALAIRVWAGKTGIPISHIPSLELLEATCEPFDGGCPSGALYSPRPLRTPCTSPSVAATISKGVLAASPVVHAQVDFSRTCSNQTSKEQLQDRKTAALHEFRTGQSVEYFSERHGFWVVASVREVGTSGVEIDVKPGYKLHGSELLKLRPRQAVCGEVAPRALHKRIEHIDASCVSDAPADESFVESSRNLSEKSIAQCSSISDVSTSATSVPDMLSRSEFGKVFHMASPTTNLSHSAQSCKLRQPTSIAQSCKLRQTTSLQFKYA